MASSDGECVRPCSFFGRTAEAVRLRAKEAAMEIRLVTSPECWCGRELAVEVVGGETSWVCPEHGASREGVRAIESRWVVPPSAEGS